jgi:hypothetical protein
MDKSIDLVFRFVLRVLVRQMLLLLGDKLIKLSKNDDNWGCPSRVSGSIGETRNLTFESEPHEFFITSLENAPSGERNLDAKPEYRSTKYVPTQEGGLARQRELDPSAPHFHVLEGKSLLCSNCRPLLARTPANRGLQNVDSEGK